MENEGQFFQKFRLALCLGPLICSAVYCELINPNQKQRINIHVKSREAPLTGFKISLLFYERGELQEIRIKIPHSLFHILATTDLRIVK